MATVNLSVNVGENKRITFHSGGTYNPEDIVFDVSANGSGYKPLQTAVSDPTASSTTSTTFIDSISQNANGVITATKKTLPSYALSNHTHSFSSITSRGEAYLAWGGQNLSGTYAPIDAAMVGLLGANRTAFVSPSAVTVEYSRDGGTTWTDYGASNSDKTGFFTDFHNSGFYIGKSTASNPANANCQLRVTLSTSGSVYTVLNKFVIYVSTSGSSGTWCSIDARLQSNVTNNTNTWANFANKIGISGWSGYNVINTSGIVTYGNTASSQYGQVRFTFGCTSSSTSYPGLLVYGVNCYGGVGWTAPSTMAKSGVLYTFDMSQNAIFPASITATKFVKRDGTSSQFLKADGSVDSNSYSLSSHTHATTIAASSGTNQITLAFGTKYAITAGGTSYIFTMPGNPNTNTTYTFATGDANGQIKVTPSGGSAQNVSVKGLGSAAYTESSAYATSGHSHTTSIAESTATNQLTLAFGKKYHIEAGGNKYVFTMPSNPNTNTTYTIATGDANGQIKVTPSSGSAYNVDVKGLGSAAYTESSAYATSGHTHSGYAASGHTHATTIAASSASNQINLAFGTKYAITAGGTSYVFTMPSNPNSDINVKQGLSSTNSWRPILMGYKYSETVGFTPDEVTDISYVSNTIQCSPGQGAIFAKSYMVSGGTSSQFLKADGSLDSTAYSPTTHTHSGYAASSHTHGNITSGGALQTTDITIANGDKLVVTDASNSNKVARTSIAFDGSTTTQVLSKKGTWVSLPSDTDSRVSQKLEESTSDLWRPILLGFDSKQEFGNFSDSITNHSFIHNKIGFNIKSGYIRASGFVLDGSSGFLLANGGVDNSSYALSNHTHSGYASSSHSHTLSIATDSGTSQITIEHSKKYKITAGGSTFIFTTSSLPAATSSAAGIAKLGASGGSATYDHTHGSITNAGAITSDTAIANGDHLVITDASDSNKIKRTSITFGTSTSTYLRNDGTWGTPSGGSGGGSTVTAPQTITLSTSLQTYVTIDGYNKQMKLPDTCPWDVTARISSPLFESDTIGSVTPIAATRNLVVVNGEYSGLYETTPTLIFPNISDRCTALPIFMDRRGHLFLIIDEGFAADLVEKYGYSTNPAGKGK